MKQFFVSALLVTALAVAAESWNESRRYRDPVSGLEVLQLTTRGFYNQGPTVHAGSAFTRDGEVVFASFRDGRSLLMSGDLKSGKITVRHVISKLPNYDPTSYRKTVWIEPTRYLEGIDLAASERHNKVAFIVKNEHALRVIDFDTGKIELLLDPAKDPGRRITHPVFSSDGESVAVSIGIGHPPRTPWWKIKYNPKRYCLVNMEGWIRKLYFHPWGQTHFFQNPVKELWLVKCGKGPCGKPAERDAACRKHCIFLLDGKNPPKPVNPRNPYKSIAHIQWTGQGDHLVYHGEAAEGGNYIGVMTNDSEVLWEHVFRNWTPERNGWNHVIADPLGEFIFDDGLAVAGQISALDIGEAGRDGAPKVIPLARWENDWKGLPEQSSHPHPAVTADGRYLVFYGCRKGQTHVYAIDLAPLRAARRNGN